VEIMPHAAPDDGVWLLIILLLFLLLVIVLQAW